MKDEAIADRLSRLEGSLRRTQRFAAALAVALCVIVTVAATQAQEKPLNVLRVHKIIADEAVIGNKDATPIERTSKVLTIHGRMDSFGDSFVHGSINVMGMADDSFGSPMVHIASGQVSAWNELPSGETLSADLTPGAVQVTARKTGPTKATDRDWSASVTASPAGAQIGLGQGNRVTGYPPRLRGLLGDEGAKFEIHDDRGGRRVCLGTQQVRNKVNSNVTNFPESTLSLWGADGELLFLAPQ